MNRIATCTLWRFFVVFSLGLILSNFSFSQGIPEFDGFDYPVGDKGYVNNQEYEFPENLCPGGGDPCGAINQCYNERNDFYSLIEKCSNPQIPSDRCGDLNDQNTNWRNQSDVGNILSGFGIHPGEDWNMGSGSSDVGQVVYSIGNGKIREIRDLGNRGWLVIIEHEVNSCEKLFSLYLHVTSPFLDNDSFNEDGDLDVDMLDFPFQVDEEVMRGDTIAVIGDITLFLPHLHFELRYKDESIIGNDTWPRDLGNGYYGNQSGCGLDCVTNAYDSMRLERILDPSDFIDEHRPSDPNSKLYLNWPQNQEECVNPESYIPLSWVSKGYYGDYTIEICSDPNNSNTCQLLDYEISGKVFNNGEVTTYAYAVAPNILGDYYLKIYTTILDCTISNISSFSFEIKEDCSPELCNDPEFPQNCINAHPMCSGNNIYNIEVTLPEEIPTGLTLEVGGEIINNVEPGTVEIFDNNGLGFLINSGIGVSAKLFDPIQPECEDTTTIHFFPQSFDPEPIPNCLNNEYLVAVSLDNSGGLDEYLLSDGIQNLNVSPNMSISLGPYPAGQLVTITLSDPSNSSCSISQDIQLENCNMAPPPTTFPTVIKSPVKGPIVVDIDGGPTCDGERTGTVWCFNQWGADGCDANEPTTHCPGGGIGGIDDTFSWDANLDNNGDNGEPVYAIEDGEIEKNDFPGWGGTSVGQLLIRHNLPDGTTYYSGYLHLNVNAYQDGDCVKGGEQIGTISNVGTGFAHLHFAIYEDVNGTLVSRDAEIWDNTVEVNFGIVGIAGRAEDPTDVIVYFEIPTQCDDSGITQVGEVKIGGIDMPASTKPVTSAGNRLYYFTLDDIPANTFQNESLYDLSFTIPGSADDLRGYGNNMIHFVGDHTSAFNDVDDDDQATCYIDRGTSYGIFRGSPSLVSFFPDVDLKRGQAAKVVTDIALKTGAITNLDVSGAQFDDVSPCYEFFPYIQTLKNLGHVSGIPNTNNFDPDASVTYAQFAKILVNALDLENTNLAETANLNAHMPYPTNNLSSDPTLIPFMEVLTEKIIFYDIDCNSPDGENESLESLLTHARFNTNTAGNIVYDIDGDGVIYRKDMAILLVKVYEALLAANGGNLAGNDDSSMGAMRSMLMPNVSNYTIIGSKLALPAATSGNPPSTIVTDIVMFDNETKEWDGPDADGDGDPLAYYWTVDGGTMEMINPPNDFTAVRFTPPTVTQETIFNLYSWVGDTEGNVAQAFIDIIVVPAGSCPPSANISVTNISETSAEVSWTNIEDGNNIVSYTIEISTNNTTWITYASNYTNTSITLAGLTSGQNYFVRIIGICNDASISPASQSQPFVTNSMSGIVGDCPDDQDDDDEDPVFLNCPTSPYVFTLDDPGTCMANVNWSIPVAVDNCAVTVSHLSGPTPGSQLAPGGYTVIYIAEDNNNNTATCTFTVIVEDPQPLEFVDCPSQVIDFTTDQDLCTASVNWSVPVATDNCDVTVSHLSGPVPGESLAPGVYQVVYEASNNASPPETVTCQFVVRVFDTQLPAINCPQDVTVENDPGVCEAVVNNIAPEFAFDNCDYEVTWLAPGATPNSGMDDASGTTFPVGTTILTYTISETNNPFGNQSATCEVIIVVEDTEHPVINCPADVTVGTSMGGLGDCEGEYTWNHPVPTDNCGVTVYTITYTNPDGSVEGPISILGMEGDAITRIFDLGATTILYHVEDAAGNITECDFTVTVIDDEDPMIFCEQVVNCNTYSSMETLDIVPLDVVISTTNVANSMDILDVNIANLQGIMESMGDLKVELTSPAGTTVVLFDGDCTGNTNFDLDYDDAVAASIGGGACGAAGAVGLFQPLGTLADFNGENSMGNWVLTLTNTAGFPCGLLENWDLEICGNNVTPMLNNTLTFVADPGTCGLVMNNTILDPPFSDNCPGALITHDYILGPFDHTLQGSVFPVGVTEVLWTVTDAAGNTDECTLYIEVLDTEAPEFLNCPRPDVIENSEYGLCGAYVNFSPPIAEDNCGTVTVTQTDNTGLSTGSVFPIGTTILEWTATDAAGNSTTCELKVIVNDTQEPTLICPGNVVQAMDAWVCNAVVNDIAPLAFNDNCIDNTSIVYQIEYPMGSGEIVACGLADASGNVFEKGTSTVTYRIADQPLLLITEVTQELEALNGGTDPIPAYFNALNGDDYLEITNFGPASVDVSCLLIERMGGTGDEEFSIPNGTIMAPGDVLVLHFGNGTDDPGNLFFNAPCAGDLPSTASAGYMISYKGIVIDLVTTNGYNPAGQSPNALITPADWSGDTGNSGNRGGIYRHCVFDHNDGTDFKLADVCVPATLGTLNPGLPTSADNGHTTALQSIPPNTVMCNFTVTINDEELPYCGEFLYESYDNASNLNQAGSITGGTVFQSVINVPQSYPVGDVNILDLVGEHSRMDDLTFKLTSPSGTQIVLFEGLCTDTDDFNLNLDDDSTTLVTIAPCGPLGNGGFYVPQEPLKTFYGENAQGDWILEIADTVAANDGLLASWVLELAEIADYSQTDTTIVNEPDLCSAEFSWIHPRLIDNCCEGTIEVVYSSQSPLVLPPGGFVQGGAPVTERFEVGITNVKYILTDASGNVDSCDFSVTVLDVEDPVAMCPGTIYHHLDPGECMAAISYEVTATDNCEVDSIYQIDDSGLTSGDFFPIGTTGQTWVAVDTSGNADTCSFDIIIIEYVPDEFDLACNDLINLSLDETCQAVITADMLLEGNNYHCYDDYEVTVYTDGVIIPNNPLVTQDYIGDTLSVTITDPETGVNCWGLLYIEDKIDPEFECPADITLKCNESTHPSHTGEPVILSCEDQIFIEYNDALQDNGNCGDPRAVITRTWMVSDGSGNEATCEQVIIIDRFQLGDVEFPANYDDFEGSAFSCVDVNNNPGLTGTSNTGVPLINGLPVTSGAWCPLSINHSDEIFDVCDGAYDILRTWSVYDACQPVQAGVNPIHHIQTLKVKDMQGPVFTCPADMVISPPSDECLVNTFLPAAGVADVCSDILTVRTIIDGDTIYANGGYVIDLPLGLYPVKYEAFDGCNNYSTCTAQLFVEDSTEPVPVCIQSTTVAITFDEPTLAPATSFDDGSFDNCSSISLAARRMDSPACPGNDATPFGDYVPFYCCDVGSIVMVELLVTDSLDNTNSCMVEVEVQDELNPAISCPPDKTIGCYDDLSEIDGLVGNSGNAEAYFVDLNGPGSADNDTTFVGFYQLASDNCSVTVYIRDNGYINNCGISVASPNNDTPADYLRIYSAVDGGGRTSTCVQRISVVNDDPFEITDTECRTYSLGALHSLSDDVEWPCDLELGSCDPGLSPGDLENNPLLAPGDIRPQVFEYGCDLVAVTYEDAELPITPPACMKILRNWIIIDWCQYDQETGEGRWEYEQIIKVLNSDAPVITSDCSDKAVCSYDPDCQEGSVNLFLNATDDCTFDGDLNYSYSIDLFDDGSENITGNGNNASDAYPIGTHRITWQVEDGCGNVSECEYRIVIEDCKAPTPNLLNGIAVEIMPAGMIEIWPADWDNPASPSFDNCAIDHWLINTPSQGPGQTAPPATAQPSWTFDCNDLGTNTVDIWIQDVNGNWAYVSTYVLLQDNPAVPVCQGPVFAIFGNIENEMDEAVDEVIVGIDGNAPGLPDPIITGSDGAYGFPGLANGADYVVTPEKDIDPLNGVSTFDLILIGQHILQVQSLPTPYKMIAADVNRSGNISSIDLLQLRRLILFVDTVFQNNTSWRFIDADFVFPVPDNPFASTFPEIYSVSGLNGMEQANFIAVKTGDVNGNAIPNSLVDAGDRDDPGETLVFATDDRYVSKGEQIDVAITSDNFDTILGYQFTLSFDIRMLEFAEVKSGDLPGLDRLNFGLTLLDRGVVTGSWNADHGFSLEENEVLFKIVFKVKKDGKLSDLLSLNSRYTKAEAYNASEFLGLELRFHEDEVPVENKFELYQNQPNPFKNETTIGFHLPEAGLAILSIYDISGKKLKVISDNFAAGYSEVSISGSALPYGGVLYYELKSKAGTLSRKMVLLD